MAAGPPEEIVREKRSYTGAFLKPVPERRGAGGKKKRVEAAEGCNPPLQGEGRRAAAGWDHAFFGQYRMKRQKTEFIRENKYTVEVMIEIIYIEDT